jgi:PKD repeat protein
LNSLEILYYNESAAGNPTSYTYEHSLNFGYIATKSVRYNISSTGWNGQYLPAYAFNTPFFQHPYTDFHLNYEGSAFTYTKAITTYKFTDISNFTPTSWSWDFGDGIGTDNVKNPTYTYTTNGTYSVCLTATSATKTYTSCRSIKITNVGVDNVSEFTLGNVYPNPISIGTMMNIPVELNGTSNQAIVKVYNTVGAVVSETKQTVNEKVTVSTENLTAGMYMFSVEINGQKTTGKFSVVE